MGESLAVPDKKGVFVPVALLTLMVTMLGMGAGVLFKAGQIVQHQNNQAAAEAEMRADWKEVIREFKDEIEAVRDMRTNAARQDERLTAIEQGTGDFMRSTIDRQSKLESEQASIREELRRQDRDYRLLKDYTEGRISGLPYRPPAVTKNPDG